jgi:hypothetical protein
MNQATLNHVAAIAKQNAAGSPRRTRAIDRAAAALASGELVVSLLHNGALVTSSNGSYFVNGKCECKAAQVGHAECYHRAAVRLVELAETAPVPEPTKKAPRITRSWYGVRSGNAMWVNGWLV